jgi:hypothetical protein
LSANIPLIKHNQIPLSFNDVHALVDIYRFSYRRSCEHYKVSAEVVGFDAIRVRYRPERREIIRHIIKNPLTGLRMNEFILKKTVDVIPAKDIQAFTKTIYENLDSINEAKIQGMGITLEELAHWLDLNSADL